MILAGRERWRINRKIVDRVSTKNHGTEKLAKQLSANAGRCFFYLYLQTNPNFELK
jgi:hypothetical protein